MTITRYGIVHLTTVETSQTDVAVKFLHFQVEESSENLDGVGTFLIDVIARVTAVQALQGKLEEEVTFRSSLTLEIKSGVGGLTTST